MNRIAIVRISGKQGLTQNIKTTFKLLRLYNKNTCVVVPNNPKYQGMIKKVKDFITWGELNNDVCKSLLEKRGKLPGNKPLTEQYLKEKVKMSMSEFVDKFMKGEKELKDVPGLKLFFKLHPPIGGYERKGTKKHYSVGGSLGYRKERINDLVQRMV